MDKRFIKGAEMPASVGLCADLYHDVRELRLAMQKEVDAVKARESEIKEYIIDNLSKSDDTGASGKKYRAQIKQKETPKADDWDAIRAAIIEYDRWDLLQKRLNTKAVTEIWEAGDEIPGVGKFISTDVSITKL